MNIFTEDIAEENWLNVEILNTHIFIKGFAAFDNLLY